MNVLLIHQAFAALGEPGGTRHHELARFLASHGHRVTALASRVSYLTGEEVGDGGPATRQVDDLGVIIWRCASYRDYHRSFAHRVLSFLSFMLSSFIAGLRVGAVDLVWGTSPPIFQGFTAWALARLKRAAFLFEVRDLWPEFAIAVGVLRNPWLIRLANWMEGFLYRRADRVVVNSPGFLEHVRARGARRVDLVPNGVDVTMFDPELDGKAFRREHGLPEEAFLAIYAGAHGMSNDLEVVLEAADRLRDRPGVRIGFIGDGKEKSRLMSTAEVLNLSNVCFLSPLPKTAMPLALAAADAGIAILKPLEAYKTTYPNKVFDYMAAGRPVVLAIDGVIRQVVEAAGAGVFVTPGDPGAMAEALRRLAGDPERARRMGLAGRAYVSAHFDRSALAADMARVMAETVEAASRARGSRTEDIEAP